MISVFKKYPVPVLLILIFCIQFFLVKTQHLTQWKGGGFGMFSTYDTPQQRELHAYLLIDGVKIESILPFDSVFPEVRTKAESYPVDNNLKRAAGLLAKTEWACFAWQGGDDPDNISLEKTDEHTECIKAISSDLIIDREIVPIQPERVHISISRLRYNSSENRLQRKELAAYRTDGLHHSLNPDTGL